MRRIWYVLVMAVLLLPLLAACGGTTAETEPGISPPTASSAAAVESVEAAASEIAAEASRAAEVSAAAEEALESAGAEASEAAEASAEESEAASAEASMMASMGASAQASAAGSAVASAAGSSAAASDIRVALVTDVGKVNDGTFNQFAYEGLQRAEEELGVGIDYIETQQPTDYDRNLEQFSNGDYDLVIGVGFLMGEAMQAVASRHPDINYAIVDFAYGDSPPANVKGLVFNEDQSGYIAGTIAALVSQTDSIGVVGGIEDVPAVKKFVEGYAAGARAQKPDIAVAQVYIPSFTDPAQGGEAATSQISEGADVIFGAGGQTGSGAIQAAAAAGAYVIGVDQDEYTTTFRRGSGQGADRIISSAVKRVDNAVFDTIRSVVDGNFSNELYVGSVENGGIDYAECHDACGAFTPEITATVEEVKAGLADGSIETGVQVP